MLAAAASGLAGIGLIPSIAPAPAGARRHGSHAHGRSAGGTFDLQSYSGHSIARRAVCCARPARRRVALRFSPTNKLCRVLCGGSSPEMGGRAVRDGRCDAGLLRGLRPRHGSCDRAAGISASGLEGAIAPSAVAHSKGRGYRCACNWTLLSVAHAIKTRYRLRIRLEIPASAIASAAPPSVLTRSGCCA